ncbi:dUTPase-like protein, partial [Coemansia mojavensis]
MTESLLPSEKIEIVLVREQAKLPEHKHGVGFDVAAAMDCELKAGEVTMVPLGFAARPPVGTVLKIEPLNSLTKDGLVTVDRIIGQDYTDEIQAIMLNMSKERRIVKQGESIAQLIVYNVQTPSIMQVSTLKQT